MRRLVRLLSLLCVGALAMTLSAPVVATAQDLRASISGTVTDPSGAPIPGASVQITDTERGVTITVVANSAGRYTSGPLVPSHYTVAVETKGFKKFVQTNILLVLSQQAEVERPVAVG